MAAAKQRLKPMSAKTVIERVAAYYNLPQTADILGARRDKEIVLPRQVSMYLMRHDLDMSFPKSQRPLVDATTPPPCTPSPKSTSKSRPTTPCVVRFRPFASGSKSYRTVPRLGVSHGDGAGRGRGNTSVFHQASLLDPKLPPALYPCSLRLCLSYPTIMVTVFASGKS